MMKGRDALAVMKHTSHLKLKYYGIVGTELEWFTSYLSNRTQVVDINGNHSQPLEIDISVFQGSILGPILINIFINDLRYPLLPLLKPSYSQMTHKASREVRTFLNS